MAQPEAAPQFLRAGDVASLLHVSPKTVARWAEEGRLPYVRTLGAHRRFDPQVIAELVRSMDHSAIGGES